MRSKEFLTTLFVTALLAVLAYVWFSPAGVAQVPDIAVRTVDGREIVFSELRGKPLLVTFWATDCPGCIKEMPHLIELHHELADRGLNIVSIAMSYDMPSRVLEMANVKKIPYAVALDPMGEAAKAFGEVRLTPTNFLIAPDGRIVQQRIGEMDMDKVRAQILTMLDT